MLLLQIKGYLVEVLFTIISLVQINSTLNISSIQNIPFVFFLFLLLQKKLPFFIFFILSQDPISKRHHATRIRFLPKGSVSFETISTKRHVGVIDQEAPERSMKSPGRSKGFVKFLLYQNCQTWI